jgi:hypothetical protein
MLVAAVAAVREATHGQTGVTPVTKVLELLQNLEQQVQTEGAAEAATYKEFACFCKDKQIEKDNLIKGKTSSDDSLTADIQQLTAKKETLESELSDLNADLDFDEGSLKRMIALRDKEYTNWKLVYDDTVDAVNSAKDAIASMKASGGALVQVPISKMPRKIKELLQQGEEPGYEFASGGILQTLENLENDWFTKQTSLEQQEDAARVAYENAKTKMEDKIQTEKDSIGTKTSELAETDKSLGEKTTELTETKALKKDAETYLKDLTEQCERKAKEWDQRSSLREGELAALAKALELMGVVDTKATDSGAGTRTGVKPVAGLTQEEDDADSDGSDKTDSEAYADVVFVQTRKVQHESKANDPRNKVITILKSKAKLLKSPAINMLAMKLAADPFAKVKELIQQLIERLNAEALNESNQKGWCDKEIAMSKHDAQYRLQDTKTLSASLLQLEAQKAKLNEVITETTQELVDLNKALNDATKLRGEEKAENKQTLTAAREGKAALENAIEVLTTFYRKSSRARADLLQEVMDEKAAASKASTKAGKQSPVDADMAAAGHGGIHMGAYKGKQDAAGGILGMLATIKSDFERTVKETTTEEETSRADFAGFSKETKASIKSNEQGLSTAKGELQMTSADIVQSLYDLRENQVLLDNSVKQLEMLRPACVDTGMSWDDRKLAREKEIQALKDCLDVFAAGLPSENGFLQKS